MNSAAVKETLLHIWGALDPVKPQMDTVTVTAFVAGLAGLLPGMLTTATTVMTLVWACLRVYEMKTVQDYLERRRAKAAP